MFSFEEYKKIKERISCSEKTTKIIAISKNHPLKEVNRALSFGLEIFGENRVQEAKLKFESIKKNNKNIILHLTGPLQSNKVKQALGLFDVFHTLDREKLLIEFSKFPEIIKKKSFFVQINTGKEITKSGIHPENVSTFLDLCKKYEIKNIDGLMCIPPIDEDPKKHFHIINELTEKFNLGRPSIGMSGDYHLALDYNPQYVRIGTALFGKRQ